MTVTKEGGLDESFAGSEGPDESVSVSRISKTSARTFDSSNGSPSDSALLEGAMKEGGYSRWLRVLLFAALLAIAIVVTAFLYEYTSQAEQDDFEEYFDSEAEKVFQGIGHTLDQTMGAADSLMYGSVAYAHSLGVEWPYAVNPDFCVQVAKLLLQSKSFYVGFYPYITAEERPKYQNFTSRNNDYVFDCIRVMNENPYYHGPNYGPDANVSSFLSDIIYNDYGSEPDNATGPFMPSWMGSPIVLAWPPYGWNALAHHTFAKIHLAAMETLMVSLSPVVNTAPADDPEALAVVEYTNDWISGFLDEDDDPSEPYSEFLFPVHDAVDRVTLSDTTGVKALGTLSVSYVWRHVLEGTLSERSPGVDVVFENPCGDQAFTYLVDGKDPTFRGHEDVHDSEYDDLCQSQLLTDLSNLDNQYSGQPINVDFCPFTVTVCPTEAMADVFITNNPIYFAVASALIFLFLLTTIIFFLHSLEVTRRQKIVLSKALQARSIVNDVFPAAIRDRLLEQKDDENKSGYMSKKSQVKTFLNNGMNGLEAAESPGKPLADLYPDCTILFADVAGFTPWSSTRDPSQVFLFLQTVYQGFDAIAKRRRVFKVETVGDCYVAASGVPDSNPKHATVMAHFAEECLYKFNILCKELEIRLGPDTGDLKLRIGMHSGPCTAGVLRGDRARFQLFGNTVNMAARMQTHSKPNRIQLSKVTADHLIAAGKEKWVRPNMEPLHVKGKGLQQTFWLMPQSKYALSDCGSSMGTGGSSRVHGGVKSPRANKEKSKDKAEAKARRLIEWNVQTLAGLLKPVVARRNAVNTASQRTLRIKTPDFSVEAGSRPLDEVQDVLKLPTFDAKIAAVEVDPESIALSPEVINQLRKFVTEVSKKYHDNPFHNFEHASHVASSVEKLLKRIVAPDIEVSNAESAALGLHDYSYGITSDPLTQFAVVLSALVHDLDHRGVSNMQLSLEEPDLAKHYQNKSLAEQNSVDGAFALLMKDDFAALRECIYGNSIEDMKRFRQIIVAVVLATDIFDKELNDARKERWSKAFSKDLAVGESNRRDFRATIVIEHLIQASDVSHTMQHWHIYQKWNERLFLEMYHAYKAGRMGKDPSTFWAAGEIGFFDNYIIPLAKKLKECNVFGVSSDEYLNYAVENRDEWSQKGEGIVQQLMAKYCAAEKDASEKDVRLFEVLEEVLEEEDEEEENLGEIQEQDEEEENIVEEREYRKNMEEWGPDFSC